MEPDSGGRSVGTFAPRGRSARVLAAAIAVVGITGLGLDTPSPAITGSPTPREITTTNTGTNQNSTIDSKGDLIAFTSNVPDAGAATFDDTNLGNGFTPPLASHPNPACVNCANPDASGQLFLWRLKAGGGAPAFKEITFSTGGGLAANEYPDINQKGTFIVWDSDRDILTGQNTDGNREIFLFDIAHSTITQVTNTSGGDDNANRNASISDDGSKVAFDTNRDYSGATNCTMADGVTPCTNSDGNSEVMIWDRVHNQFTQITNTTGDSSSANARVQISAEGLFLTWQSTRDFSSLTCTLFDGMTPCSNGDGDGEIVRYDIAAKTFTQVTATNACGGSTANERPTISKKGQYIVWQSTCESQLDTPQCGSCNNADEVFIFDFKQHRIVQVTTSSSGTNRVPHISETGSYIVFESNRNFKNLNPSHARILYIVKRNTTLGKNGLTGPGQLVEDTGLALTQNPKTVLQTINFAGGFNTTVEQFGVSSAGKYISFDNGHGGGGRANQEIWFLDRTK